MTTNVPLMGAIGLCAEALYKDPSSGPPISKAVFIELIESATSSVEFSFNDRMYKQTDGVAGLTPGPRVRQHFCRPLRVQTIISCSKSGNLFAMLTAPLPSLNKRVTLTISWSRLIVYILISGSRLKKNMMAKFHF